LEGKISTNREHYLSVSSFINFFLILLVNKQMHDLTNLHQCFINIILPSQQLLGSSSFCYILYSLHLIQIGDTNTSKSRAYTNSNIATTIVPLFWTRNIYQLVNFEDSNSNKIVYASLQMLTTFLLFLNFLIYSGIHVINIY
jgi:hypothetical protein